ncbi:MAG TPA: biopolymer transporter ExbD [Candidatus Angelobacter sp.]|jgi:biopolymer transport protein ExbD/biopolymer transport protein TolR|nr:biopolymer transporter ExbD [Candidatus Angelobacter sp.]
MAIVLRNEGAKINSNINVTPMVDVMLVLLIIFMVITPMLVHGVPLDLARTTNPTAMSDASKPDALILSVMRDGQMFLGSERVTGDALTLKVRDTMATRTNKTVYVRADARARYGTITDAVDGIRSVGVDQLGLLTEQRSFVPSAGREPYSRTR